MTIHAQSWQGQRHKGKKEWQEFVEYLKSLPPEKLSQPAKWMIEQEEKGIEYWIDERAVLK